MLTVLVASKYVIPLQIPSGVDKLVSGDIYTCSKRMQIWSNNKEMESWNKNNWKKGSRVWKCR